MKMSYVFEDLFCLLVSFVIALGGVAMCYLVIVNSSIFTWLLLLTAPIVLCGLAMVCMSINIFIQDMGA